MDAAVTGLDEFARRPLALVTGASSGIGFALAAECASHGFELVVVADEPAILDAADAFASLGVEARPVEVDLATPDGVNRVHASLDGRTPEVLIANAGRGLGGGFLEQDFDQVRNVIGTNITGMVYLIHKIARDMRRRGSGRILITGSIPGFAPGIDMAVYNATNAFINSFAPALRRELRQSGVTVTCLMPGATDTAFFERAGLADTVVGRAAKDDPNDVARMGFQALMRGEGHVAAGQSQGEAAAENVPTTA